ncbi:MAG TPA: O-antigen ligase family protein [Candidatus Dormibacteraeota bacterium]|nr:O-antigen ligase family protein [Candidatus Dormibacteraeota bacterium]
MSLLLERAGGFFPAAVAFALPVVFIPNLGDLYILPRASIVIAGACLGVGLAFLAPATNRLGALRWPLLAAALAALLAFAFSVSWPLGLAGSYTRYESLPMRLSYLGLAASAAWLLRSEAQRTVLAAAFVTGCSIAAVEALMMAFSGVTFRPDGNLGNANLLAGLLVMALPVALDRARRAEDWWLTAWVAAIVVMGAGLLVTTSRSGYLGLLAGLAVLVTLSVPRRATLAVGAASLGIVAAVMAFFYLSPLRVLNDDPPELRLHLWADSLRLIAARPLTGWGEDTTGLTFGHYLSQDYATLVTFDRIHSGPLDLAATQGVLGLAATGAVVGLVLWFAWRNRSRPYVPGLAAALAGYSAWVLVNFDWSPATGAFWLLLGALWSASLPLPTGEQAWMRGPAALTGALATVLALAVIPLAVFPVLADAWYLKGRADLAVRVAPLQAQYHWAIGTLPELRTAASLGETDPSMYVQLGDAELQAGNRAQALSAYRRALEIDPYYTPAMQRLTSVGG